ncbi:MAG: GAF domain-containing protein, partial [Cytophagales bacterium]|nr:GAF domain-containing protein [Cytophagales bacterium]
MRLSIYRSKRSGEEILSSENQKLKTILSEASNFIKEIKNGNFNIDISKNLSDNELGVELLSMKLHFDKVSTDEKIRNWFNTGLATFSDILRNKSSLNLKELSDDILSNLVKYISANQGAIFVIENDNNDAEHLRMIACYAYNRKKYLDKRFELGEGLAGQCVLEKEPIYLKEIPEDFVNITSGLGEATPRSVFICPLIINERIFGVIELASLTEFKPHHIDFINKLSENVAACIKNVRDSEQTNTLLNESRQQAEELRAQEEEMRQNLEEMQATQEEMKRKSEELRSTSAEILGIINGINATMATIEFSPDGTIIKANDNFLKTMKYTIDDIKGKHHRMFAPIDVLESDEYKTFWQRLASGESITGVFKRISRTGDT